MGRGIPEEWEKKFNLRIRTFEAQHASDIACLGLVLEFLKPDDPKDQPAFTLGISSDTAWTDTVKEALKDCDAVIAHFSKTRGGDFLAEDEEKVLPNHLGYIGTMKLLQSTSAELCVIAEWSGDLGDLRYEVSELLRLDAMTAEATPKTVLPADVGLMFSIPDMKIRCSSCGIMVDHREIIVGRPTRPFGRIMYYCPHCLGMRRDN